MSRSGLESASAYERLMDLCPAVFFRQRADSSFEYISPRIEEWSGYSPGDWLRQPGLLEELAGPRTGTVFRMRNRKTGRTRHIRETRQTLSEGQGTVCEGVWTDVSEQWLAVQQSGTTAWQAALGLMTTGAAHDVNNKLTGVLSLSELYLADMEDGHPLREGLGTMRRAAQQASQLLHQLVSLHQLGGAGREHVDLDQFASATAELLRRVMPNRITVETNPGKGALPVTVDRVAFQKVILTWAMQAAGRMPKPGVLRLKTGEATEGGQRFAQLKISDTGREWAVGRVDGTEPLEIGETAERTAFLEAKRFAIGHGGKVKIDSKAGGTTLEMALPEANLEESATAGAAKRWVLVAGGTPSERAELADEISGRGLIGVAAGDFEEQLSPTWYEWDALVIRTAANGAEKFLDRLRAGKVRAKTALYLTDEEPRELEAWVSGRADVVIPADVPRERALERIGGLFM